ncbi:MAG: hypothetical protein OEZ19_05770 [Paracoccaceae bacterium]|nr:hypothetical protein [Paracoccaceae bacterium]
MSGLDLTVIAMFGAGGVAGWVFVAKHWWRTLLVGWVLVAGITATAFIAMERADDWGAYFYLAIWMFFAGPLTLGLSLGAAIRGALGWLRRRRG